MEHNYIVLIRPKSEDSLMPRVATFEGSQKEQVIAVEVNTYDEAMRDFKLTVQLDTSVAKQVYPYNNAIGLIWEGGESNLVDQIDSFDFIHEKAGWVAPRKINVLIYAVDPSVRVQSIGATKVLQWADVTMLDQIYAKTHKSLDREILQRTFSILPRIQFEVK